MVGLLEKATRATRLRFGRPILDQADQHRDRADWFEAAVGYRRAAEWLPWRHDLHIQLGNCLMELGDARGAATAYGRVTAPEHRDEAARQIVEANRRDARGVPAYVTAERPDLLAPVPLNAWNGRIRAGDLPSRISLDAVDTRRRLGTLGNTALAAATTRWLNRPAIVVDQVGAMTLLREGASEPLLAGVVAVRARIASLAKLEAVELWLGEHDAAVLLRREPVRPIERGGVITLHVLNAWIDSTTLPPGRHWLEIRAGAGGMVEGLFVTVANPTAVVPGLNQSDGYVPSPEGGGEDVAAALIDRPAEARSAARSLFDGPIRSVLVIRADQLGDVSASLPALARLRELLPDARLTILVQPAVRAVIEASRLADEVLTVDIRYDLTSERRFLPPEEEARVCKLCRERAFDLAIDLCPGDELRPLLLLTGATWLVGFDPDRHAYLDFGVGVQSRDKVNRLNVTPHAATVMTLVEGLGSAIARVRPAVPRRASSEAALAAHRLVPGSYVVMHLGARHALNRWPAANFLAVAEGVLAETRLDVVIFVDDPAVVAGSQLLANERIRVLSVIDGDAFDAVLSNARLMIANDSGPKHLAAARGVETVSLHANKLNWDEWGQDSRGVILSKRVPCAGCGVNNIDFCGRDAVCLRSIKVEEVLAAARRLLAPDRRHGA